MTTLGNAVKRRRTSGDVVRVMLVQPHGFSPQNVLPIALAYLKSNLLPETCEVRIVDCALRNITARSEEFRKELLEFKPEVVGVSSWSPMFLEALDVMRVAKEIDPDILTVTGGAHPTSYYPKVMENPEIDFIFRGEAEFSFRDFISQLYQGEVALEKIGGLVYRNAAGNVVPGDVNLVEVMDDVTIPDYDAINLEGYIANGYRYLTKDARNAPIWLTRGCPYRCQFCAAPQLSGKPVRRHSKEYIARWVHHLYHDKGIRWMNIIDDNFTFHKEYAKDVCRSIIDMNLTGLEMATPNGIRLQRGDPELWRLMRKAGWKTVIVAPESGSEYTLKLMKKDLDLNIVPGVVDDMRRAGLHVIGFFILGYPGERREDIYQTRKFLLTCRFSFVIFHNFQAIPGTPVFDTLVALHEISADYLPGDYHSTDVKYRSKELADFDMKRFILETYLLFSLRYPLTVPNLVKQLGVSFILSRFKRLLRIGFRAPLHESSSGVTFT